ncbi:MAG TPA: hypothetical protein VN112_14675 [Ensifer sp.]|nr:hypothetical protein [Ensifer sp.]
MADKAIPQNFETRDRLAIVGLCAILVLGVAFFSILSLSLAYSISQLHFLRPIALVPEMNISRQHWNTVSAASRFR